MPARRQLLQKITLNANAANVTFSNIPQTFTDLRLVISARTDRASDTDGASVRFNGDTGTNYSTRLLEGSGSATQSRTFTSQTSLYVGQGVAGGSSTASTFGNAEAHIPNYTGSTQKAVLSRGTSENNATVSWMSLDASLWTGTAAITSITLLPINGPNFVAGSTFYLYGLAQVPVIVGGTETISGGYKIHTFTATSSLRVVEAGPVEYLVVAGGGGGPSGAYGGGGGAGGLLNGRAALAAQGYSVTVGAGGAGSTAGSNSVIANLTALGGGRGSDSTTTVPGGGSGGGGAPSSFGAGATGGAGTAGQGNNGGNGTSGNENTGGGGGAGSAGSGGSGTSGGAGGSGLMVFGSMYAGGGAGAGSSAARASGGSGGGGNTGLPGTANTGGGGGGSYIAGVAASGGSGGSGIVIIRYPYITN